MATPGKPLTRGVVNRGAERFRRQHSGFFARGGPGVLRLWLLPPVRLIIGQQGGRSYRNMVSITGVLIQVKPTDCIAAARFVYNVTGYFNQPSIP